MSSETVSRASIIGRADQFPESGLLEVQIQGRKLLLVKDGSEISCIAAECPHAGGPLAQGILHGGRVICPWHKAAFDAGSGKCLEPPALADVAAYDVTIADGDIVLGGKKPAPELPAAAAEARHFVILGAGAAGFSAAAALRAENFGGRVTLIDQSAALPGDRTALSKAVLAGQAEIAKTALKPEAFYEAHDITRQQGEVTSLDAASKMIGFLNGETLRYDAALIATGGTPQPIPFPGSELGNVFLLRSQVDAARIAEAAGTGKKAVIIGTGFIAMEAAASLRERGLEVTVIGQETVPFEKTLGGEVGRVLQSLHEEHGVKFVLGAKVEKLSGNGVVKSVELANGETFAADLVIAGLGVQPATGFIKGLHLEDDGGIAVTDGLRASAQLYAAGDIAAFPLYGSGPRLRVEHWRVAEQQGRIAARAMLGAPAVFDAVPYFWTIHFKKRLDYAGHAKGDDKIIVRGDLSARKFIVYYLEHGKVAAAAGMNENQNMAAIIELLGKRRWRVDELHPAGSSPVEVLQNG